MKKLQVVKSGTIIESGLNGAISTGVIKVVIPKGGLGNKDLFKCEFNTAISIKNVDSIAETVPYTKTRKTHLLYKSQFVVMDY